MPAADFMHGNKHAFRRRNITTDHRNVHQIGITR